MKYKEYLTDHGLSVGFGTAFLLLLLGFGEMTGVPAYFLVTVGVGLIFFRSFCTFQGIRKKKRILSSDKGENERFG